ncbi:hypothetical protein chiPu_0017896, partial [Chiloscyllium punctatum]|nr:hypothetical protein [Chiloscyllium punctatum]
IHKTQFSPSQEWSSGTSVHECVGKFGLSIHRDTGSSLYCSVARTDRRDTSPARMLPELRNPALEEIHRGAI